MNDYHKLYNSQLNDYQKLYNSHLHEWVTLNSGQMVLRVAGGWIYVMKNNGGVFVPFDNEFQGNV